MEKIAVLGDEVEAQLLAADLRSRDIPHVLRSYFDSAMDGIYQAQKGWGHVEAPAECREEVLTILESLRREDRGSEEPWSGG